MRGWSQFDVEGFYYLARAALVKDERHIDRFDQVFSHVFKGVEALSGESAVDIANIPEEWLRRLAEKHLTEEEKKLVEALGGFEKLMETLRQRLEEQKGRHQGGSKWIGTAGTSPFGAYGYNPEGVRIGQQESRNRRAVKVWDRREFRNFDDSVELGTRNIKVALKRLRRWVREGAEEELDLPGTIHATAEHGYLDVQTRPERRNAVKLLMFFDVGGSMDDHVRVVEELFSAARAEFRQLEYFYFHNCLYEGVWKDNRRRMSQKTATFDVLHKYGPRLQGDLRRRRRDEPLRDRPARRLGRALERRGRRGLAGPRARAMAECRVDQPDRAAPLGLHAFDRHGARDLWRPHVPADAGRPRSSDPAIVAQALTVVGEIDRWPLNPRRSRPAAREYAARRPLSRPARWPGSG